MVLGQNALGQRISSVDIDALNWILIGISDDFDVGASLGDVWKQVGDVVVGFLGYSHSRGPWLLLDGSGVVGVLGLDAVSVGRNVEVSVRQLGFVDDFALFGQRGLVVTAEGGVGESGPHFGNRSGVNNSSALWNHFIIRDSIKEFRRGVQLIWDIIMLHMFEEASKFSINDFTLIKQVGKGAFSTVFECLNVTDHKKYALKIISTETLNQHHLTLLKKEIEIHKQLDHENIIKFHGYFVFQHYLILILDYCEDGNLFNYLNRKQLLSVKEIRKIFCQVVLAIKYIHEKNFILRDLKPENILINIQDFHIRICDFGWAARIDDIKWLKNKAGTFAYMSPESLQGKMQTQKSDIWSLGILLFELFFNIEPYAGTSCESQYHLIMNQPLKFGEREIPREVKELIGSMLQIKPQDRITVNQILSNEFLVEYYDRLKTQRKRQNKGANEQRLKDEPVVLDGLEMPNPNGPTNNNESLFRFCPLQIQSEGEQPRDEPQEFIQKESFDVGHRYDHEIRDLPEIQHPKQRLLSLDQKKENKFRFLQKNSQQKRDKNHSNENFKFLKIYFPQKQLQKRTKEESNDKILKVKINSLEKKQSLSSGKFKKKQFQFKKTSDKQFIKQIQDMINYETQDHSSDSILQEVNEYIQKQQTNK